MLEISSLQNQRIKQLVNLTKRRERDRLQLTIVEGVREIRQALGAGIVPKEVFVCPDYCDQESQVLLTELTHLTTVEPITICAVTQPVFAKIAYRGESGGLLMTIPYIALPLANLAVSTNPFFVIVEGAEKPGNLGAILRTADAAGVDGVIACTGGTDLHNPNIIRASLGAIFTTPIVEADFYELLSWLRQNKIRIITADPMAQRYHMDAHLQGPIAIVVGSEAFGLQTRWLQVADISVKIPMFGSVDSLNLSVATAVMLYEAVRQRLTLTKP